MVCQCRLITCNQCTTPVGDVDNRDGVHVWGQMVYGNFLYLFLSFAVKFKLLSSKKVLIEKKILS